MKRSFAVFATVSAIALAFAVGWLGLQWVSPKDQDMARSHAIDIGFAQFMSRHHQQAIAMAQLMLDGRPSPLRQMAQNIAYTQLLELGEMQAWLKLWGQPLQPTGTSMTWMLAGTNPPSPELKRYLIECERAPSGMPGLATLAELELLRHLDGLERDAHFLELMLAHHEGGLPMARFAAQYATEKVVRDRAKTIALEQAQEMYLMRRTLAAMPARASRS